MPGSPSRGYKFLFRLLGLLYLGGAALVFFLANQVFYIVNLVPGYFTSLVPLPESSEKFWLVQGSTNFLLTALLCFTAAQLPTHRSLPVVLCLAKLAAAAGYVYLFQNEHRYFAYLLGAGLDGCMAVLMAWAMIRVGANRHGDFSGSPDS